ncbi:MAG: hypothetical protein ACRYFU_26070 [Janthinobacterium lividum]
MFLLICAGLACLVLIIIASLIIHGAWTTYTPWGFVLYLARWGFMVTTGVCALHSTLRSSAPRRQAEGTIAWIASHGGGKSKSYTLGFRLPSGVVLPFHASPTPPFFAEGRRDIISITYLDEKVDDNYPRAIGFRALTGPRAGDHEAVSADWFGPWLGVLLAPLLGFAAFWKAYNNKRPIAENPTPSLSIIN